ncbi:MAG: ACT domain-containing protein, partial [Brevundimonas sp.]
DIVHRIVDFEALMLAMFLHDVGKGGERGQLEDGAIAARRACDRLGVDPRRTELVVWLVRNHLALSDYAQKRDVSDPTTVRAFAELVGDPERLRLLLVLTVADIRAVGPGVWNSWKGQLIRNLYERVEAHFRGEDVAVADPLADHPDLVARARAGAAAVEVLNPQGSGGITSGAAHIAVAAPDRARLFADLAATLAEAGADVVGARAVTAAEGVALDIFEVQDGAGAAYGEAEPRRLWTLMERLEQAARGERLPAPPAIPKANSRRAAFEVAPAVMIDFETGGDAAVIEVSGGDRPGLLADVARVLADHGLSIRSAHVAGFGERAVDSFYVTDSRGRKPKPGARLDRLRHQLETVLDQGQPPSPRGFKAVRASLRDVSELGRGRAGGR